MENRNTEQQNLEEIIKLYKIIIYNKNKTIKQLKEQIYNLRSKL
jgi:hypothetical protein